MKKGEFSGVKNSPDTQADGILKTTKENSSRSDPNFTPIFTPGPIPKKFWFPQINDYFIDMKPPIYEDSVFCIKKFVPHYNFCLKFFQSTLETLTNRLKKAQERLIECFQRRLVPQKKRFDQANADYWRKQVILYQQKTILEREWNETIIAELRYSITIVKRLIRITEYLIQYPRFIMINQPYSSMLQQAGTRVSKKAIRIKALEIALSDTKIGLMFTPKLNDQPQELLALVENIIKGCSISRDPITGYIPETDHFLTFETFMKSNYAPTAVMKNQKESIDTKINFTINMLNSLLGIKSNEDQKVLASLCSRYWFTKLQRVNYYYKYMRHPDLPALIKSYEFTNIKDLGLPKILSKHFSSFTYSCDIFQSNPKFFAAGIDQLTSSIYLSTPVDIANSFYMMNMVLSGFVSTFLKKPMDHKDVKECMPFMWTALFIYLNLPAPDSLINFAMRWSIVDSIPEIIVEKCKVPQAVIAKWTEKCAPLPKRKQTKETTQ